MLAAELSPPLQRSRRGTDIGDMHRSPLCNLLAGWPALPIRSAEREQRPKNAHLFEAQASIGPYFDGYHRKD